MKKQIKLLLSSSILMVLAAFAMLVNADQASAQFGFSGTWCKFQIDGNDIDGESTTTSLEREGMTEVKVAAADLVTSREMATGGLTGRRQHRPFTIVMPIEKSIPLLYKALTNNEPVTQLVCKFFRQSPGGAGSEEHFYTILIENGYISSINTTFDRSSQVPEAKAIVGVVFQDITWTYVIGGATHTDSLREQL